MKKVLKGFNYAAVSPVSATITDANGIVLCELQSGSQGYFVASTDTIDCGTDAVSVVQIQGNFVVPSLDAGSVEPPQPVYEAGQLIIVGHGQDYIDLSTHITYGGHLFAGNTNLTEWYGNMPALTVAIGVGATSSNMGMYQNCTNLTTFISDMPSLQNAQYMFSGCTSLETFEVPSGELTALTDGYRMFNGCSSLTSVVCDFPLLIQGYQMFLNCTDLETFEVPSGELPEITIGFGMFGYCSSLKSFSADMPKLTNAQSMFQYCTKLETFELPSGQMPQNLTTTQAMFADCSSLTEFSYAIPSGVSTATYMMYGTAIESFESDIPQNCQDAQYMFGSCTKLETFTGRLHSNRLQCQNMFQNCTKLKTLWPEYAGQNFPWSLRNVNYMFQNCTSLESFPFTLGSGYGICTGMFQGCSKLQWTTPLPSALYSAVGFFGGCKLNKASVEAIINSPSRWYQSVITIGIDSTLITQEEQDAYNAQLVNQAWTVTWERN